MQFESSFPGNSCCPSTLFTVEQESTRLATLAPFPSRSTGRKPCRVGTLLLPNQASLLKASTGVCRPFFVFTHDTRPHVRSAPSDAVEQEKPDTARRVSGDPTASGQINLAVIPLNAEESQLSSIKTGSEPPASLGLIQIIGCGKSTFWPFFDYGRWCHLAQDLRDRTRLVHQGPSFIKIVPCRLGTVGLRP